jgi:uracil-DNA glycosylase family protein
LSGQVLRGSQRPTVRTMRGAPKKSASEDWLPHKRDLRSLTKAAKGCRACHLYAQATQTVFGEGPANAWLMLVGEQPGDQEDIKGHPFVGPAGGVLNKALIAARIPREEVYVTNAVKHFKNEPRGKRRLHVRPDLVELWACKAWLEAEIQTIRPRAIVALGSTAAEQLLNKKITLRNMRGRTLDNPWQSVLLVSYHPSAILRAPEQIAKQTLYRALVQDLLRARALV